MDPAQTPHCRAGRPVRRLPPDTPGQGTHPARPAPGLAPSPLIRQTMLTIHAGKRMPCLRLLAVRPPGSRLDTRILPSTPRAAGQTHKLPIPRPMGPRPEWMICAQPLAQ